MLRFVCIALALAAVHADEYYPKGKGLLGSGGVSIANGVGPSVGLGPSVGVGSSLGIGSVGLAGAVGRGASLLGSGIGLGGNVLGNINSLGGVNTFASGIGGSPAFRGAVQGAATGSALGVLSGRPSRVSGVSVGVGGGQTVVSGNVRPIGGGAILSGPISLPSLPVLPQRDIATFQGSTVGNVATGSVNSLTGGYSLPYGGILGTGYGINGINLGYGYGSLGAGYPINLGYGYGSLGLGNIGLGSNVFSGVSQSLLGGNAVFSGQALGPALGNIPVGGSVNFNLGGVGPVYSSLPGPLVSPAVSPSSVIVGPAVNIQRFKKKVY